MLYSLYDKQVEFFKIIFQILLLLWKINFVIVTIFRGLKPPPPDFFRVLKRSIKFPSKFNVRNVVFKSVSEVITLMHAEM